jgi:hypothetical protein
MNKSDVYSWRVSAELKNALEAAARFANGPFTRGLTTRGYIG